MTVCPFSTMTSSEILASRPLSRLMSIALELCELRVFSGHSDSQQSHLRTDRWDSEMEKVLPLPTSLSTLTNPPVDQRDVPDDRQAQAGSAQLSTPGFVHAIETFEQARQMLALDPATPVLNPNHHGVTILGGTDAQRCHPARYI